MNVSTVNRVKKAVLILLVGAFFCLSGPRLFAGDPIDFSGGRGKTSGPRENKLDEERLKPLPNASPSSILRDAAPPDSTPSVTQPRDTRDSREERRKRLAREERKYFLLYEPGELQKKDKEGKNTGLGDYSLGGRDEKSLGRNWLSDDPPDSGKRAGAKGATQRKDNRSEDLESRARQAEDAENERKKGDRASFSGQLGREPQAGAHTVKELDFRDLFTSGSARSESASSLDKGDFTLRDVLGAPDTVRNRAQEARLESFRQMLDGTSRGSSLNPPTDAARLPGIKPPPDRAFDTFGKTGGRDVLASPSPASSDFGNKFRSPAADNSYQRPSPFQNGTPSSFNPSEATKSRGQPADFESLKKRVR